MGTSVFSNILATILPARLREGFPAILGEFRMFPFVLVQSDDDSITAIVWGGLSLLPAADEEFVEFSIECSES